MREKKEVESEGLVRMTECHSEESRTKMKRRRKRGKKRRMKQPEQLREGQQTTKHHRTRDNQIEEGPVPQTMEDITGKPKTAYITMQMNSIHITQNMRLNRI